MGQAIAHSAEIRAAIDLLKRMEAALSPRDFTVRFWDASSLDPEPGRESRFALVLQHPGSLRQMLWPFNHANVGEAYIYNDIDIEGDSIRFMEVCRQIYHWALALPLLSKLSFLKALAGQPNECRPRTGRQPAKLSGEMHSKDRDRQAIHYHYDVSNAFFEKCLDRNMVYTCAYFRNAGDSLENAQEQKLDIVCRKLRLKPGERLLDIGCGWGGLVMHAASKYGARAAGITLSRQQFELANERVRAAGLQDQCQILFRDYREFNDSESFDCVTSIEMYEAVGTKMLPTYFDAVARLLKPGGRYLHQAITKRPFMPIPPWAAFTYKYVFPDGELVTIGETTDYLARVSLEVRDIESLREHYALTLRHWLQRLEANHDEIVRITDEVNYRIFRIFFAGACHGFESSTYNLYQVLAVKPADTRCNLPSSREDWYE